MNVKITAIQALTKNMRGEKGILRLGQAQREDEMGCGIYQNQKSYQKKNVTQLARTHVFKIPRRKKLRKRVKLKNNKRGIFLIDSRCVECTPVTKQTSQIIKFSLTRTYCMICI